MRTYYRMVRELANIVAGAIAHTTDALVAGRIESETAFTDRMIGAIEQTFEDRVIRGVRWRAKTLTDRVPNNSQETRYGADFMGVLSVTLPDFELSKGFLAQAKLIRPGRSLDRRMLIQQCEKMLHLSSDSFVFLYDQEDQQVRVVPAVSVIACNGQADAIYSRSAQRFFEEHFQSFIGDRAISAPTPATLEKLRSRFETRTGYLLQGGGDIAEQFEE